MLKLSGVALSGVAGACVSDLQICGIFIFYLVK